MGMLFSSQAVVYLQTQLSNEFRDPAQLAKGWGTSDDAVGFREALDASKKKKNPTLAPVTLEYLNLIIPDWGNGDTPSSGLTRPPGNRTKGGSSSGANLGRNSSRGKMA